MMDAYRFPRILCFFCTILSVSTLGRSVLAEARSQPTFKVDVNLVLVNATVTGADGHPVTDLAREDFLVTEDLKEQKLSIFQPTTSPFHVVLLIDTSASTFWKLEWIRYAALRFFDQLSPADQIALLEICDSPKLIQSFTSDRARLHEAVQRLGETPSNSTKLYDSIIYALDELLSEVNDRKALVILTDACDNGSQANEHVMKRSVYGNDAVIYGLIVDTEPDEREVLRENLQRLSRVSLVLCADDRGSENDVKKAARLLVAMLPRSSRVSVYQNVYRRSLVNTLSSEVSREKIDQAIEESKPFSDSVLRPGQGGQAPADDDLIVAIIQSIEGARERIPAAVQAKALPLLTRGFSEVEIRHQITKILADTPVNAEEIMAALPESYRRARGIFSAAAVTTGGRAFDLAKLEQVEEYYSEVAGELRTIYTLGYYSSDSSPLLRSVEVKIRKPGYTVKARKAYLPRTRSVGR